MTSRIRVQEQAGARLDGGVGTAYDPCERHADELAPERSPGSMDKAWRRLLRFLANGDAQEATVYEHVRNRLLQFFAARGTMGGEELADATFDRIVAKLSDEVAAQVHCPIGYVLRFAHFIHLEHIKSEIARHHRHAALRLDEADTMENVREEWLWSERLALVERCLDELAPSERTLLLSYYMYDGRSRIVSRQKMSRELGITPALLRTRVSRLLGALNRRVRALADVAALDCGDVAVADAPARATHVGRQRCRPSKRDVRQSADTDRKAVQLDVAYATRPSITTRCEPLS